VVIWRGKIFLDLEKRFGICKEVGEFKKENGEKIEDKEREGEIIQSKLGETNLSEEFVGDLFEAIFKESKRLQKEK
jgi:chorismate mutase